MSRQLIAKDTNTITRNTSLGEVSFVEGIATTFTDEQAAHFVNNFGYTLKGVPKVSADIKNLPPEVKEKAEEVLKNAHTEAENIITKANEDAKKIVDAANSEGEKIINDAEGQTKEEEVPKDNVEVIKSTNKDIDDGKGTGVKENKTKIEIPDENTAYPVLMKLVKDYKIDTKGSKKAADVLAAVLADPRFQPKIEE